ncbi:MAG TPA: glycosyltransferase family 2 protein [Methylibium sp.]|nr:glycosyltransferase family 2 protein [Methylibium sp.]
MRAGERLRRLVRRLGGRLPGAGSRPALLPAPPHGDRPAGLCLRLAEPLPAGWYLLRTTCTLPALRSRGRLWLLATGGAADDPLPRQLPLRHGRPAMRLLHVTEPTRVEFEPAPGSDEARVQRFSTLRVPRTLGRHFMHRRLRRWHPAYAGLSHLALWRLPFDEVWTDYNLLFDQPSAARLDYPAWIERAETPRRLTPARQQDLVRDWVDPPRLLWLLAAEPDAPPDALALTRSSLEAQGYPHWELQVLGDGDPAAALQRCDAVGFLEPGDRLRDDALYQLARALRDQPAVQVCYSDSDRLDRQGRRQAPWFKPGFSRDLCLAQNLLSPLAVVRAGAVVAAGGLPPAAGAVGGHTLAYGLLLRALAGLPDHAVRRLPEVLCHARAQPRSAAGQACDDDAALRAVNALLAPAGAHADPLDSGLRRVRWPLPEPRPLVSLIVPTRNALPVLRTCIESITRLTRYRRYELLVVDNQSDCPATLAYLDALQAEGRARVLRWDAPFNYSAINNFAVRHAQGSVLGLINNDVEVISPYWLDEMASHALRPDIGCVGAKLYFPDDTLQHAGVVLGIGGVAGHGHKYLPRHAAGYFDRLRLVHEASAVTGAVLVLRREVFDAVGGFDEQELQVAYNDVDLCLRVMRAGWRNLWTPHAELYHHESKTRGSDDTPAKRARWQAESAVMRRRWPEWLADDPFYHPHLSRHVEDYSLEAPRPAVL